MGHHVICMNTTQSLLPCHCYCYLIHSSNSNRWPCLSIKRLSLTGLTRGHKDFNTHCNVSNATRGHGVNYSSNTQQLLQGHTETCPRPFWHGRSPSKLRSASPLCFLINRLIGCSAYVASTNEEARKKPRLNPETGVLITALRCSVLNSTYLFQTLVQRFF